MCCVCSFVNIYVFIHSLCLHISACMCLEPGYPGCPVACSLLPAICSQVWVEIFVPSLGRYVHADPCEKSLDAPLTYEAGWNKKLSYVFAFSRFGVTDVIHRYSRKFSSSVCQSRSLCSEKFVQTRVKALDEHVQQWYCQQILFRQQQLQQQGGVNASGGACLTLARLQQGSSAFAPAYYSSQNPCVASDLSLPDVVARKQGGLRDLQLLMFLQTGSTQLSAEEMQGRISGDEAWKQSRGEAGTAAAGGGGSGGAGEVSYRDVEGMEWLLEVCE